MDQSRQKIDKNLDPYQLYEVELSMLEIYNEKIIDLLDPYSG